MFCSLRFSSYEKSLLFLIVNGASETSSICPVSSPSVVACASAVGVCSVIPKREVPTMIDSLPGGAVLKFVCKRKSYGVFFSVQLLLVSPYAHEYRCSPLQTESRPPWLPSPWWPLRKGGDWTSTSVTKVSHMGLCRARCIDLLFSPGMLPLLC